ncbi:RidA family protein [Nocardioides litoris]|uniref:RidA family protein n=1 Tax=Nocardioides litoris TaxID=1926648 RepID=UPI00111E8966|nr:RidA family protein [Nocardioides litoris]
MTVQLLDPHGMLEQEAYHHVAVARGTTFVTVAGQVGWRAGAQLDPDDLPGQVGQALRNAATGLAAAGATYADVVRLTFYVTRWSTDDLAGFMSGVESVAEELAIPAPMPPASLIGVEALYDPDARVEVEVTAVLA